MKKLTIIIVIYLVLNYDFFFFRKHFFDEIYLVVNANKYKHFERWATASDFPTENIINDGSTLPTNALGALADFELTLNTKKLWNNNVMVIAGDMLFQVIFLCNIK